MPPAPDPEPLAATDQPEAFEQQEGPPPSVAALPPPADEQQDEQGAVLGLQAGGSSGGSGSTVSKLVHGTCGWSDASLVRCGRFYPPSMRAGASSEEKLRHYSRHFGCVEVDTSTFAIPRPDVTAKWAKATVDGFLFHVKAFGLFPSRSCQVSALPAEARSLLPPALQAQPQAYARLGSSCPPAVEDACWRAFHAACEPLYRASRLGCILFQFHLGFQPSQANLEYILRCRQRLDARFCMAAELRCRAWFTDPAWRARLSAALAAQGISLVSADELQHETEQKDREQTGLPPGAVKRVLPICLEVTTPGLHYVRVHRRHGTTDRLLPDDEIAAWAARLQQLAPRLSGPIYFLWGTDWEDTPMVNARNLDAAVPPQLRLDWRAQCKDAAPPPGSIQRFFKRKVEGEPGAAEEPACNAAGSDLASCSSITAVQGAAAASTALPAAQKRQRQGGGVPGGSAGPKSGSGGGGGGGILRFLQRSTPP